MRRFPSQQSPYFNKVISILALFLVLSFGLHTFQVDHTHPGSHNVDVHHQSDAGEFSGVAEYLHGSEKKLFLMLLLGLLALGTLLRNDAHLRIIRYFAYVVPVVSAFVTIRMFDHTVVLFKKGILNPRTH